MVFSLNDQLHLKDREAWGLKKPRIKSGADAGGQLEWDKVELAYAGYSAQAIFQDTKPGGPKVSVVEGASYLTDRWGLFKMNFRHTLMPWTSLPFGKVPSFRLKNLRRGDDAYTDLGAFDSEFNSSFQLFSRMEKMAAKKNAKFVVLMLPEAGPVFVADEKNFASQKLSLKLCERYKIRCVEPHEQYVAEQPKGDLFFRDEGYPSARGAAFTAQIISEELQKK